MQHLLCFAIERPSGAPSFLLTGTRVASVVSATSVSQEPLAPDTAQRQRSQPNGKQRDSAISPTSCVEGGSLTDVDRFGIQGHSQRIEAVATSTVEPRSYQSDDVYYVSQSQELYRHDQQ
eukprot:7780540-Lingulodinium_polyedra.AAC.1